MARHLEGVRDDGVPFVFVDVLLGADAKVRESLLLLRRPFGTHLAKQSERRDEHEGALHVHPLLEPESGEGLACAAR